MKNDPSEMVQNFSVSASKWLKVFVVLWKIRAISRRCAGRSKELDIERAHGRSEESARRASTSVDGRKGQKKTDNFGIQKNQKMNFEE